MAGSDNENDNYQNARLNNSHLNDANTILQEYAQKLQNRCVGKYGWGRTLSRRVWSSYRQFLELKLTLDDWDGSVLSPPELVDKMWQQHVLDNRHYEEYCRSSSSEGNIIYYNPDEALSGAAAREEKCKCTKLALRARFANQVDWEIWGKEGGSSSSMRQQQQHHHQQHHHQQQQCQEQQRRLQRLQQQQQRRQQQQNQQKQQKQKQDAGEDSEKYVHYKEVGELSAKVPLKDFNELISVSEEGPSWKKTGVTHDKSTALRKWIINVVPPHLGLAFHKPVAFTFQSLLNQKRVRGRPRIFPYAIGMKGHCSEKCNGCETTFSIGFKAESLMDLVDEESSTVPDYIDLFISMAGTCKHVKGKPTRHKQVRTLNSNEESVLPYASIQDSSEELEIHQTKKRAHSEMEGTSDDDFDGNSLTMAQDDMMLQAEHSKGHWRRMVDYDDEKHLREHLITAMEKYNDQIGNSNKKCYEHMLEKLGVTSDQLSYCTFNIFIKTGSQSKKGIKRQHYDLIKKFLEDYPVETPWWKSRNDHWR